MGRGPKTDDIVTETDPAVGLVYRCVEFGLCATLPPHAHSKRPYIVYEIERWKEYMKKADK